MSSGLVLLYTGRGSYSISEEPTKRRLEEELDPRYYKVEEVKKDNFYESLYSKNVSLLVIPGGSASDIEDQIFSKYSTNLDGFHDYMRKPNSRYLGLGAGGILGCSEVKMLDFANRKIDPDYHASFQLKLFNGKAVFCQENRVTRCSFNARAVPVVQDPQDDKVSISITTSNSTTTISGGAKIGRLLVSGREISFSPVTEPTPFNTFFMNGFGFVGNPQEEYTSLYRYKHLPEFTDGDNTIKNLSAAILCCNKKAVLTGNNFEIQGEEAVIRWPELNETREEMEAHMRKVQQELQPYKDQQQKAFRSFLQALGLKTI